MAVCPSFNDFVSAALAELQARRPDLPVNDGDVTEAMLHAMSVCADVIARYLAQAFKETFIDGARGQALTDLVDDHLNIQRHVASAAVVPLTFSRPTAGAGAGTILAGTRFATTSTADGKQVTFTLDSNVVFSGVATSMPGTATAELTGVAGNVTAGTVTSKLGALFDATIVVTNPDTAAGGSEEESDDDLRERARGLWQTLARGTIDALVYGAKRVAGVSAATVFEDDATGLVTVRVADSSGNSNLAMAALVAAELENWRAAGVAVTVDRVTKQLVNLVVLLRVKRGFSVDAVASLVNAAITARINKLEVGETLYFDTIVAAAIGIDPDNIVDVSVDVGTDTVPAPNVLLRAGTITTAELTG